MSDGLTSAGGSEAAHTEVSGERAAASGGGTAGGASAGAALAELAGDAALGARRVDAAPGHAFYEPDAPAERVFVLHEGQVRTFKLARDRSARLLEILGPGDWFGAQALAQQPGGTYGTRAVAVTAAVVWEVPAERLLGLLPERPALARGLVQDLAAKLQAAHDDAATLVFQDTNSRLVRTLLQFSRTAAASRAEGDPEVVLRITHQQLAQAVGAARETVSLALTQLRQRNLLRTGRNKLSFNPDVLEQFAKRGTGAETAQGS